jgi:hypothetical protein
MLWLVLLGCRLNIMHTALVDVFALYSTGDPGGNWYEAVRPHNYPFVKHWAMDMLRTCDSMLSTVIQCDRKLLGTLPDYVFDLIGYAAGNNTGTRLVALYFAGVDIGGPSQMLVQRTVEVLSAVSNEKHYPTKRCANMLQMFVSAWQNRDPQKYRRMREERAQAAAKDAEQLNQDPHTAVPAQQPIYGFENGTLSSFPWPTNNDIGGMWGLSGFGSMGYQDFWNPQFATYSHPPS